MSYLPCIFFRAKCFAKTPIHVIFGRHYEAVWKDKPYKSEQGAINFARRQIKEDSDVWQVPASKKVWG